jgi:hypothetical protein
MEPDGWTDLLFGACCVAAFIVLCILVLGGST